MALPEHTVKDWKDTPSTSTPLSAAALEDLESRLADHASASATEAITQASAALTTHGADTTSVHGIADTTALALKSETTAAIATAQAYTNTTVNDEAETRADVDLMAAAADPSQLLATETAWDTDTGLPTVGTVRWPDGATGTYTATCDDWGVASYVVTHVLGGVTRTFTQPTVTRNADGRVTPRPAIVES